MGLILQSAECGGIMARVTFLKDSIEVTSVNIDGPLHKPTDPLPVELIREAMDQWGSGHAGRLDIGRDDITPGHDWDQVRIGSTTYSHRQFTSAEFSAGRQGVTGPRPGYTATQPPVPSGPTILPAFNGSTPNWGLQDDIVPPAERLAVAGHNSNPDAPDWALTDDTAGRSTPVTAPETAIDAPELTLEGLTRPFRETPDQAERRIIAEANARNNGGAGMSPSLTKAPAADPFADTVPMSFDAPELELDGVVRRETRDQMHRRMIAEANARNNGSAPVRQSPSGSRRDPFAAPDITGIDIPGTLDIVHADDYLPLGGNDSAPALRSDQRHELVLPQPQSEGSFTLVDKDTSRRDHPLAPRPPAGGPKR